MKPLELLIPVVIWGIGWNLIAGFVYDALMFAYVDHGADITFWSGAAALALMFFAIWVTDGVLWALGCVKSVWTSDHE